MSVELFTLSFLDVCFFHTLALRRPAPVLLSIGITQCEVRLRRAAAAVRVRDRAVSRWHVVCRSLLQPSKLTDTITYFSLCGHLYTCQKSHEDGRVTTMNGIPGIAMSHFSADQLRALQLLGNSEVKDAGTHTLTVISKRNPC